VGLYATLKLGERVMPEENRKLVQARVDESLSTNHIEPRIGESVNYSETTKHIEIKLSRLAANTTGKGASPSNAGQTGKTREDNGGG
jgi:hypothetical protein